MDGRPQSFSGAVGQYRLNVIALPTQVRVGDPIELTIDIYGDANVTDGVISGTDHDPGRGTRMTLRGRIIAGADVTDGSQVGDDPVGTALPTFTAPVYQTRIWGNDDVGGGRGCVVADVVDRVGTRSPHGRPPSYGQTERLASAPQWQTLHQL